MMNEAEDPDTFKILIATDNHLGYGELNPTIENDSFVTFEEILLIANNEKVDFILLGGDLFHESRPSPPCLNRCIELIRQHCLGNKCVEIEIVSEPSSSFHGAGIVNYEDPNLNIAIPIFSIHGNHDDPTGNKQISALDLMSSTRLINYFGRCDDVTKVEVEPVLIKKGQSKLALYGLSHIRDERLARLFVGKKVKMKTPPDHEDWFNLMVLHQNRANNRGAKNFIAESVIPKFMNLVMWGHEHDCLIDPTLLPGSQTYLTQPGSSVATSLSEGEALVKKVGLLRVKGKQFHISPIELKTVRPFIYKTIDLEAPSHVVGKLTHADVSKEKIRRIIKEMIEEANALGRSNNLKPLIRLVVRYLDERQIFNAIRFGQEFASIVANAEDIVKFLCLNKKRKARINVGGDDDDEDEFEDVERLEDLITRYLDPMKALPTLGLNEAVKKCIDANDIQAPIDIVNNQEEYLLKKLEELQTNEEDTEDCVINLQKNRNIEEIRAILNDPNRPKNVIPVDDDGVDDDMDNDSGGSGQAPVKPAKAKGRGSRGARGSKGGRGSKGPRDGDDDDDEIATIIDDDDDDSGGSGTPVKPARGRGSRGGKGSRGPRGSRKK